MRTGACTQALEHMPQVHSKEDAGRQERFNNALVHIYEHLVGTCTKLVARTILEKRLQMCTGACMSAFGHICEVHSKEDAGRQTCFKKCPSACIQAFGQSSV